MSTLARAAALFALVLCTACAGTRTTPFPSADVPNMAPPPYTAEQIRDSHPDGAYFVTETLGPDGEVVARVRTEFFDPDTTSVSIRVVGLGANGEEEGADAPGVRVDWPTLRSHAYFPAAGTRLEHTTVTVPVGTFDCWSYRVIGRTADGLPEETVFHFAVDRPGPPVLLIQSVDGVEVARMRMVEDGRP
jgi:hypothetical protein